MVELAERLRHIRKERGMTLQQLSKKSGVWAGTISKLETGKHKGTFKTHEKLCQALDIKIVDLYQDIEPEEEITSITPESEEIETFLYDNKVSSVILTPNALRKNMLPVLIVLESEGKTRQEKNQKGTEKFLFCLEGEIEITIGERTFQLHPNGILYFKSSFSHQLKNTGKTKVRCLCVSSPATL